MLALVTASLGVPATARAVGPAAACTDVHDPITGIQTGQKVLPNSATECTLLTRTVTVTGWQEIDEWVAGHWHRR